MSQRRLGSLDEFARQFIAGKTSHEHVRTEELAEAFRRYMLLPPFPTIRELLRVCGNLRIKVERLPLPMEGSGINVWSRANGHEIYVDDEISLRRAEHTICHELREVLEQTFCRVSPAYQGLDTHDNKRMNPESDHFAACLLMQAEASRDLFRDLGYDVVSFAEQSGRSLSSVIQRAQELFSAKQDEGPTAGIWLFSLPWDERKAGAGVAVANLRVSHLAHLRGFSIGKPRRGMPQPIREAFPRRGSCAAQFEATLAAFRRCRPFVMEADGFDLFGEHDFIVLAEPLISRNVPWQILMAAVRRDCEPQVRPWLARLGRQAELASFQRA